MPISLGEWFLTHWNDHVKERNNPDVSKRPLECTVGPGDILFVPHGWWHCVLNLDNGMSIALTQNYVSRSNLPDVLRFLKTKPQQISGCRDRAEAIQPNTLLETFQSRLKEKHSVLLEESSLAADKGWLCAAWKDDVDLDDLKKCVVQKTSVLQRAKMPSHDDSMKLEQRNQHKDEPNKGGFSFSFL